MGLLSKFFSYQESIFVTKYNILDLCPNLYDEAHAEDLLNEGVIIDFENTEIF